MPLSFRRSYRKRPTADLDPNNRRVAGIAAKQQVAQVPAEFRARRYPLILPIGCTLAVGLCLFALFSQGLLELPRSSTVAPVDVAAASTTAVETELARLAVEPEVVSPTELPPPAAPPASMSAQAAAAANPWVAEIPEAGCIPADLPQAGRVVEVVDGDTIKVLMDDDGRVYSIRYLGVEAPALGAGSAGLGQQGMALNTQLTYRRQALMVRDITDSDASGTLLRYVLADGIFVNHALIRAGLGQVRMDAPDTACLEALLEAQQEAQAQALGLWGGLLTSTAAQ